jgi:hypothetical protein
VEELAGAELSVLKFSVHFLIFFLLLNLLVEIIELLNGVRFNLNDKNRPA